MTRSSRALIVALAAMALFGWRTWADLRPLPNSLTPEPASIRQVQFLDRHGTPLTVTYQNPWNVHDHLPVYAIPLLLQQAFVQSEDKRFYEHAGVDWLARLHAVFQNLKALRVVRGASTLSEQVVRMLHPRPRTLWSRWLEGLESARMERRFSKAAILEFYLNQVPYARQRRGISQAAREYFDREPGTLNPKEMLALAVLVRAPGRLDLTRGSRWIQEPLARLAERMHAAKLISDTDFRHVVNGGFELARPRLDVEAAHFVGYLKNNAPLPSDHRGRVFTTLDAVLQKRVQNILNSRLKDLRSRQVSDGAVLVLDHQQNDVLAWVNGGGFSADRPGGQIDAVTIPRQPGSTLKPFLYAHALAKGWTAATLIDDAPLTQPVGVGLHAYRNYSRRHYGPLRLRDALGNSLNIPAVKTIGFVGREPFLQRLHSLGFGSLSEHPDTYGDGLALGNGEVTLLELVQAYAVLARGGVFRPVSMVFHGASPREQRHRVFSHEVSSLIGNILSDPGARGLEFGGGHLLRFPVQTAVKTGTSSDYRDAWAVGFSHRFTVGVWMGNLDQQPMREVSGSIGPALVLRAVFAELNRHQQSRPLPMSRRLKAVKICRVSGRIATPDCPTMVEWFRPNNAPRRPCSIHQASRAVVRHSPAAHLADGALLRLLQPTPGLQLAMDPRIPDELEAFAFRLPDRVRPQRVEWVVDGHVAGSTWENETHFLWRLSRGTHTAQARVWLASHGQPVESQVVKFIVK